MPFNVHNYTTPNWGPLVKAAQLAGVAPGSFMWMCEHPQGTHQYKHIITRRYAHLRETGQPMTTAAALVRAASEEPTS